MAHKLVTSHDPYHVHKTLGLGCLSSFLYHYGVNWPLTGSLGATTPILLLHVALSCSGIQFTVPAQRILKWPTMIWEEYRLHAVVFSFRALPVAWLDPGLPRAVCIAAVHMAADEVTRHWGRDGNTTVRGDHDRAKSRRLWWMTRSYAVYQYLALASHLVGRNGMDLGYNSFIAVQSSAFCMTLHRKGLITWKSHAIVYLICIALSAGFIVQSLPWWQIALALCAGYARMHGLPKYPLWILYWGLVETLYTGRP
jgi:hypothetical protein